MKLIKLTVAILLFAFPAIAAERTGAVAKKVFQAYAQSGSFQTVMPLLEQSRVAKKDIGVARATWLTLDTEQIRGLIADHPDSVRFHLPMSGKEALTLDLVRVEVTTQDFSVATSDGRLLKPDPGLHFRGIVSGREDTLVALSMFEDEVMAVISTADEGDLVLGRYPEGTDKQQHILYRTTDMERGWDFVCGTEEPADYYQEVARLLEDNRHAHQSKAGNCVKVYFECDYAMYQEKGGVSATTNYVTGMFNVVAAIYQNENIDTAVQQVYVWTSQDNYSTSSSSSALNQFQGRSHNADLAHLLARGASGLGGVAWLNVLCSSTNGYAYSNINSSYSNLPTYSWTVGVVTHEMGHNLGSPHTHSCSWSGGALDNCYTTEGSCSSGPAPPSSGGTIMSYCHLTSYGIDLTSGFGSQPGNLIRNRVNAASCLDTCSGGPGGCNGDDHSGSLSGTGQQAFEPNGSYYYAGSGNHSATLTGPSGTDFDLYLWKWVNGQWQTVDDSLSPSSNESISYNGSPGYYTWRVYSYSGSGAYSLCVNVP